MTAENQLALACTSCRFAHYVTVGSIVLASSGASGEPAQGADRSETSSDSRTRLSHCLETHAAALSLREMDVFEERVVIRCAECRRQYALAVTAFETHQK